MGVKKDELDGFISVGSFGEVPQIAKREVNTAVLVDDGQTVVIGGVYEFSDSNDIAKVPFRRYPGPRQPVPQQEPDQDQGRIAGVRDAEGDARRPALIRSSHIAST